MSPSPAPPKRLWFIAIGIGLLLWICSASRHALLQSNAYDLGLFDQWVWLISQGLPPVSSMEDVHVLADHGAWMLYIAGAAYGLVPSVQWLLASQAMALSLTALPVWSVAKQAGLTSQRCWLACGLWWLQPVVFNTALFDFHPETWVMPLFVVAIWAERAKRERLWWILALLMLGARDGLVLILGGYCLNLLVRRRWRWGAASGALALGWLLLLSRWLYPLLRNGEGPKAASRLYGHLSGEPLAVLTSLDWSGGLGYLLMLALPCAWLWRRQSLPTLLIGLPLLMANLLSASPSTRDLVHHYSLPLAVVAVVAAIDGGLQLIHPRRKLAWCLLWASACWLALATPWFFSGPYLQRVSQLQDVREAIAAVPSDRAVLTTSYLVPQLSQRRDIGFPKRGASQTLGDSSWSVLLLNPNDPGWGSTRAQQRRFISQAKDNHWTCRAWTSGLTLCLDPAAARPPHRTHSELIDSGRIP